MPAPRKEPTLGDTFTSTIAESQPPKAIQPSRPLNPFRQAHAVYTLAERFFYTSTKGRRRRAFSHDFSCDALRYFRQAATVYHQRHNRVNLYIDEARTDDLAPRIDDLSLVTPGKHAKRFLRSSLPL